ncbi:hypothetical protein MMOR_16530 [Mycolicibacterium moriokaense]|uniref:Uncharacterized protein n=2 Tax=Mycolicibacterium moriokaense TaxID=39691 RepID=A0AAD1H8N9_9MYCO|nr:hypothetical protein MMOR_16530 [Mycolicibacterium moriokaense]
MMTDRDGQGGGLRRRFAQFSSLQERFEASPVGQVVISALVIAIIGVGVAFNLPESPIKRTLDPVVGPAATATYINQQYALFAPDVPKRTETVEVQVLMDDGTIRGWTMPDRDRAIGGFAYVRWLRLMNFAVTRPEIRPGIARWAAHEVAGPSERPVQVAMVLRVQNLPPPGENIRGATAMKVLYSEDLTGQQ